MTMLITKFHRLIQNKVLWITFMLLVVISFVFWGAQAPDPDEFKAQSSPGELNGKAVPLDEFNASLFSVYVNLTLQARQPIRITSEIRDEMEEIAWKRLIALRKGRELGISIGKAEVQQALQEQFSAEGSFDYQAYTSFVEGSLSAVTQSQLGVPLSRKRFESHIGEELLLSKLRQVLNQATLISPSEIAKEYSMAMDEFSVAFALMDMNSTVGEVDVTEEQARDYFTDNKQRFELPERVNVEYVKFPLDEFADPDAVSTDQIETYFNENLEEFSVITSNNVSGTLVASTNAPAESVEPIIYRELEEVSEEIREALAMKTASFEALKKANNLVDLLFTDQEDSAPGFNEAARLLDKDVRSLTGLSQSSDIPEVPFGAEEILKTAFQLYPNEDEYFSNPVPTEDGVYVLALTERIEPRIPTFYEVKERVMPFAKADARVEALRGRADELVAALEDLTDTNAVAGVFEEYGLAWEETGPFTTQAGLTDASLGGMNYNDAIVRSVFDRNAGETADPVSVPNGILVAYVLSRVPADPATLPAIEGDVANVLHLQLSSLLFQDWQSELLADANFRTREEIFAEEEAAIQDGSEEGVPGPDVEGRQMPDEPETT